MDQLEAMRVFQAVADTGGFAAAARHLRISPATATRALAGLERRIGATLLRRSTRAVSLTDAGRGYLAACRRLLAELDEADRLRRARACGHAVCSPSQRLCSSAACISHRSSSSSSTPIRKSGLRWSCSTGR